jgi:DNA replication protein DnaC
MEASSDRLTTDLGSRESSCDTHGLYLANGIRLPLGREVWSPCQQCGRSRGRRKARRGRGAGQRERERLEGCCAPAASRRACRAAPSRAITPARTARKRRCKCRDGLRARLPEAHRKSGESLILAGKPGTGKGHLAAAVMNALMPEHLPIYTTCLDMIRSVRDTWRKDSKYSETQVLQEYEDAALLIIDEIGVQYGTEGEQTVIFDVLDRRYRQMRPTIFITNQDRPASPRSSASAASTGSSRRRSGSTSRGPAIARQRARSSRRWRCIRAWRGRIGSTSAPESWCARTARASG